MTSTRREMTPISVESAASYDEIAISAAHRVGDLVFVSGQTADESGTVVGIGDFAAQVEESFKNLERVLVAAETSMDRVIKVTIFVTDMRHYDKVVAARKRHFTKPYPADSIVEVSALARPELMIEIEAIALAS